MLILTHRDVEELLDIDKLIDALAVAMVDLSAGRAAVPKRNVAMVNDLGLLAAMPAYLPSQNVLASKLVTLFPGNAGTDVETHQAIIAVFDPKTGGPIALMDGTSVTAIRTAAGSALATRLCARSNSKVLAIIGTGVQARSHANAIARVRNIGEVVVAGRSPEKVNGFAAEIGARAADSYREAVEAADVVCCCTSSPEPVVRREWLRPGTHVNSVGMTKGPEVDPAVYRGALVVVESREAVIGEFPNGADDISMAVNQGIIDLTQIGEIGVILQDRRRGRVSDDQISIYRSVGVAVQDAAAAGLVLEEARARGIGSEIEF